MAGIAVEQDRSGAGHRGSLEIAPRRACRRDIRLRRKRPDDGAPTGYVGDHADKLSRVPPVSHWPEEERPTGTDRDTYHSPIESLFEPVPFPKWLQPRARRRRKGS